MVGQAKVVDKLRELARNLWWTWQPNVITLFRELDPALWRATDHNPIEFLKKIPPEQLERLAGEVALHSRIDYAFRRLSEYLKNTDSWGNLHASSLRTRPVAYFSAEFGLHESLPIYSGGLGVLAGDHLKSVSDLGVPLVGIGLLYAEGYFRQTLDADGWQQETYLDNNPDILPIEPALGPDGKPIRISIDTRRRRPPRQGLAGRGRPDDAAPARLEGRGELRIRPGPDLPALRRRRPGPDPPGAAARRRRRPGGPGAGHPPVGPPPQRRPQRLRRPGDDPVADGVRGDARSARPPGSSPR